MNIFRRFYWELRHLRTHPYRYYGTFNFLHRLSILNLVLFYLLFSGGLVLLCACLYEVYFAGSPEFCPVAINFGHRVYFSLMTQISPGFTEFLPSDEVSRVLASLQSVTGLIINAFFLSLIFIKAVHPGNIFEISPFMLHSPKRQKFVFRYYSTFPEPVFDIKITLVRFYIFQNSAGEQVGRSEEIQVSPSYRKVLRPNYGILVEAEIGLTRQAWDSSIKHGNVRKKIPWNWFDPEAKFDGHYYLIVSGTTSAGESNQICDFHFDKYNMKCGEHLLLNHEKKLTISNWYDYRQYGWKNWNKIASPDCSICSIPTCVYNTNRGQNEKNN